MRRLPLHQWSSDMTKPDDHAGSGVDKPDPKTLLERLGDSVKSVLPKKPEPGQTGTGTVVPPAD
jgi:hypothetical protein